jgi:hypothetical protein
MPERVVQRGIRDTGAGDAVVRAGLAKILISRSRTFDIEQYALAQDNLNSALGDGEFPLPEGITVSSFTARLDLDMETEQYVRRKRGLAWEEDIASQEQVNKIGDVRRQGVIRTMTEKQEQEIRSLRVTALREAAQGDGGLLIHVVAQDPSQLRSVLQEVAERQDIEMELKMKVFQELVANKLIQPADVDVMWQTFFQKPRPFGAPELSAVPGKVTVSEPRSRPADVVLNDTDVLALRDEPGVAGQDNQPGGAPPRSQGEREDGVRDWRPVRDRRRPEGSSETS